MECATVTDTGETKYSPNPLASLHHDTSAHTYNQPQDPQTIHQASILNTSRDKQGLKLLTWNARGLNTNKYDMKQCLHMHRPDIFVVSETKLHNSTNRNWLNKLLTGYKWWSSPKGTGRTLVGVRTEVAASLSRAKLTYQDDDGR